MTLAHKIKNRVIKENVFDESVMAVISKPVDMERIQRDLAEQLGLKFKETSLSCRARRLGSRLTTGGKRILVVLDDVWEPLKLEDLGFTCKSGCAILITSRVRSVFSSMNTDEPNVLVMQLLNEEEAWCLFTGELGICAEDQNQFSSLAQEIANQCKCLTLALVAIVMALIHEKETSVWEDALQQLRRSDPEDLSEVLEGVYTPLKLSYDCLGCPNAKSIFLLCSLFPEDFEIRLGNLTDYLVGLRLFRGLEDLKEVGNRTKSLVGTMKNMPKCMISFGIWPFTLLQTRSVLSNTRYNSTYISSFVRGGERIELSKDSTFPNLRLLLVEDEEFQISDIFFKLKEELNLLSIRFNSLLTSLLLTTHFSNPLKLTCIILG